MIQLTNLVSWGYWGESNNNDRINELHVLVVTISVLILVHLWFKSRRSNTSNGAPLLPPGPRSFPIVGYLPFLSHKLHTQFTNMAHTYGPIFKFKLGSKLHVVINTPELVKVVVRDQDEVFSNRDQTAAALAITYGGQDIVLSKNNPNWHKLRKILVHEIPSNKNLKATGSFRRDEVRKTVKNVFSRIGTAIDIRKIVFTTETNVLTRIIWGNTSDKLFTTIIEDGTESNFKRSQDEVRHEGKKDFVRMLLDHRDEKDGTSLSMIQIKALLLVLH